MGKKPGKNEEVSKDLAATTHYPEVYSISSKQFPPVKDFKAGKEVVLIVHAKPNRISIDKKGEFTASLDIIKMAMGKKQNGVGDILKKMYPKQ